MHVGKTGYPGSDQLRRSRIGRVHCVILLVSQVTAVVGKSIRRPRTFVSDDRLNHAATIGTCANGKARQQLRIGAASRHVIDVYLRTTAAVLPVIGSKQLASFVDLQR